jgi:transcriptional regulator with XRE-family HTH domain
MNTPSHSIANAASDFGPQARALRQRRNLTLDRVAELTGLTKGHLSRFERGEKALSVAALLRLAAVLNTSVSSLLGEQVDDDTFRLVRREERKLHHTEVRDGGYGFVTLSRPTENTGLDAFILEMPANAERINEAHHGGEESFYVLDGEVEIRVADKVMILAEGDYLQFPGRLKHVIRGRKDLNRVFIVIAGK